MIKEGYVPVTDGKMYYKTLGEGEPLILIHSVGLSSELWRETMEPLSQKFKVYAPDLIGHGNSDKPDRCYLMSDHAARVFEFMDAMGIKKARVIGSSIGAMIAIEMASSHPERITRLVLVATPVFVKPWERIESAMFMALRYTPQGDPIPLTIEGISFTFAHPDKEILAWSNGLRAKSGIWCKRDQITIAIWDPVPLLPLIKSPTLILYGRKDMLTYGMPILEKGIKGAKSAWIEDASHFPQIDNPKGFLEPILKFL